MTPTQMQLEKIKVLAGDLGQAINRLKEALALEPTRLNKDATIQRFEFSFELSWKLMNAINKYKGVSSYGPRESIRTAARASLLDNPEMWMGLLDARNLTTHLYKEAMSDEVYAQTKHLVPLVEVLIQKTQEVIKKESID